MSAPTRPLLRYHGGKWRLAPWIIAHFPPHRVYVEPFGGGGSVLLRKPRSFAEVYNDLDGEVVNLFRVARDHGEALQRAVELTPFAREEFDHSFAPGEDPVEQARRTVARSFMGFGGNLTRPNRDQTPQRTGFRNYSGSEGRCAPATEWRAWPEALSTIVDRLRGVIIERRDAVDVMEEHDAPSTLHYVDPPYVHATRVPAAGGSHRGYRFELSDDDHRALARVLRALRGSVVLSGYACELYDRELYPDWHRNVRHAVADGGKKRTEVVWLNPECSAALRQQRPQLELAGGAP